MKKIILVIIFLQIVNSIQSQNTWEYFRRENDLHEVIVSSLESGIYMISLTDQNNTVIYKDKFIKIK